MLPRESRVLWRSRHRLKLPARDSITEKRISEQRPQGRQQTRDNGRRLQGGERQHRGPSLSDGFGGCSRKQTWQELREGVESRNKGRRCPGATGALTALRSPVSEEAGGRPHDCRRRPRSGRPRRPESLRVTSSRTRHAGRAQHTARPRPRNSGVPVSSPPSGTEGHTCRHLPASPMGT